MAVMAIYTHRGDPKKLLDAYGKFVAWRMGTQASLPRAEGGLGYYLLVGDDCIKFLHTHETEEQECVWMDDQTVLDALKDAGFKDEGEREVYQIQHSGFSHLADTFSTK